MAARTKNVKNAGKSFVQNSVRDVSAGLAILNSSKTMKKQNKFLSKNLFFSLACFLLIILFIFLIVQWHGYLKENEKNYNQNYLDMIDQRLTSLIFEINIFPGGAGGDVIFLSKLSRLKKIGSILDNEKEVEKLGEDFLEFIKENSAYYQLRYINEKGMEVVRVDFDGTNYEVIQKSELQDKSLRYYFKEAMKLNKGEVYISPLDLNVEDGIIENRGTTEDPMYVSVIRFATPVFDDEGNNRGIIIANVYADYFLNDIRRAQREREIMFLVNEEGYYLAHPNKSKEFSFMFDEKQDNFYNDYPDISEEILSNPDSRRIENENLIFSYRYLYPTVGSFEMHEGAKKVLGDNPEDRYFWILVSVSDKGEISRISDELKFDYIYFLLFSGAIILIVILSIYFLWRQDEK